MAATIYIRSLHGATGASATNVDGVGARFKLADNDTIDANNPIVIPPSGTTYSYIKNFEFYASSSPANTINNLRLYSDGGNTLGTGIDINVRTLATLTGTADSGTTTALTDTGAFVGRNLTNFVCEITAGTQSGQKVRIASNTDDVLTFAATLPGAIDMPLRYIPAGRFLMGSPDGVGGSDEGVWGNGGGAIGGLVCGGFTTRPCSINSRTCPRSSVSYSRSA